MVVRGSEAAEGKKIKRARIPQAAERGSEETRSQHVRRIINDCSDAVSRRDQMAKDLGRIEADFLLRMEERARNFPSGLLL